MLRISIVFNVTRGRNMTTGRNSTVLLSVASTDCKRTRVGLEYFTTRSIGTRHQKSRYCANREQSSVRKQTIKQCNTSVKSQQCVPSSWTLERRIRILQDLGASSLNADLAMKLNKYIHEPATTFKRLANIPDDRNISENLLNCMKANATDVEFPMKLVSDNLQLVDIYRHCYTHFRSHLLQIHPRKILFSMKSIYSISAIIEAFNVLNKEIGCNVKAISNAPRLLYKNSETLRHRANQIQGSSVSDYLGTDAIQKYPKLLLYNHENMEKMIAVFRKYNISMECILKKLNIFTLDADVVDRRLQRLMEVAEIRLWKDHLLFINLIKHYDAYAPRIEHLRVIDHFRWCNINILTCTKPMYERKLRSLKKKNNTHYVAYILSKELGPVDSDMVQTVTKNQNWQLISFLDMETTLIYLKRYFTVDEIRQHPYIVLYPWNAIADMLEMLKKDGYNFTGSQLLALAVYMLERDTHFSDNGIWYNSQYDVQEYETVNNSGNSIQLETPQQSVDILSVSVSQILQQQYMLHRDKACKCT